jgi:ATP-dependent helicase/nuclease subunit A
VNEPGVLTLPLPDAAARARIAGDLETNLMVEAGAGSGKTTELVGRMVALVGSGTAEVDAIAAVTFTRKAAGELRERFQTTLERTLRAERSESGDPVVAERLARALEDIDRAFIGTIHSFCARLLRERPLEVGLDPAFEELPLEQRLVVRRRFWESYLERLTRDSDPVLEDLARAGLRPASLVGLFDQLVENPDVDFPAPAERAPTLAEIGGLREELEELVDHGIVLMPEREPAKRWDSLQKKLRTLHFTRDVTGWREPADLFEALATLCKPGPRGHQITQNRWKDGALAKALCRRVDDFAVGDTPARRLVEQWYAHRYALAIRLARHAARGFEEHRIRVGRLDFQDLLVLAARLLRTNPSVRRQLGTRYRHLLVDEFQDTDPLQAEIVLLLASEPESRTEGAADAGPDADIAGPGAADVAPGADGAEPEGGRVADWRMAAPRPGALFVVGDPKQSIYRFRRADIQLYALVKERFAAFGAVVELTTNFRSRPPIGDLVNELFHGPGFFPVEATPEQAAFEPLDTRPSARPVAREGVFVYDIAPDANNLAAAAEDDAARVATWVRDRIDAGERAAGDFLILTRRRASLATYARALEAHGIPVQVTGAGVGVEEELREFEALLEYAIDPTNAVKVVAALVGLFFGLDYERLVAHRLGGGDFDVMRPRGEGHPDVVDALRTLHRWWRAAATQPADIFVAALVEELGLLPFTTAGELGSLRAGALAYALDAVRVAALAGDASLPGALGALRSALYLAEAEAPLEPGRADTVRLMNLHQAKGLEAPVVVLADPSGSRDRKPEMHTVRSADGSAVGYLRVVEAQTGWGGDRVLAMPVGWEEKAAREELFEAAEEVRLTYVAVTRAKEELVVARWAEGRGTSPWASLEPWLGDRGELLALEARAPAPRETLSLTPAQAAEAAERAASRRRAAAQPTYRHVSVTEVAKSERRTAGAPAGVPGAAADVYRGVSWGSAVHGALAAAAADATDEGLRATCRDLLVEQGRPLDDHGEPTELGELLDLVRRVHASSLWARALDAERHLVEVPFAAPREATDADAAPLDASPEPVRGERGQLDLFGLGRGAPAPPPSAPTPPAEMVAEPDEVLEGVIDLAFREGDGWVVADYKTDVGTDPDFPGRLASYRRQVELYADAWSRLTGEPVKERVLFFTAQDHMETW